MAAGRHNLTRRALLGAGAAAPFVHDLHIVHFMHTARPEPADIALRLRWTRALAAFRRAEAQLAAFKAAEARLPARMREWPHVRPLERKFGDLEDVRLAALGRLFRLPAPDLAALALKLDLAVVDLAWELTGCETCLEAMAADARRLSGRYSAA
jgi:hypothetical protein